MLLNTSNDSYYQNLVEQITSKKALKNFQSIIDYRIHDENSLENYQLVKALLEGISWKSIFDKKGTKENLDSCRLTFLSKKIKTLCFKENFVDFFPFTFTKNQNFEILSKNLKGFIAQLKLNQNHEFIIITSLSYQNEEQKLKSQSIQILKEYIKEILDNGNQHELTQNFTLFLIKFFNENSEYFEDFKEDLKNLFEQFYQQYKDPKMRSLFGIGDFNIIINEQSQIDPLCQDYIKYLHRPVPLHKLLEDLGPQITNSKETLIPILKKQQIIPEKDVFLCIFFMLKQNFNITIKGYQHEKEFSIAQATFEFLNFDDFNIDNIFLHQDISVTKLEWNIQCFLLTINEIFGKQFKWADVFRCFITKRKNIFEEVQEQQFFQRLFLFLRFMQVEMGQNLTHEILCTPWQNNESQAGFLYHLFLNGENDVINSLGYHKLIDKKQLSSNLPSNYFQKFKELPLIWQNVDLVRNLIDQTSKSSNYYQKTLILIKEQIQKNFDQMFYMLISLDICTGNEMFIALLESMLNSFFKTNQTSPELIENFYQINKDFLVYLLVKISKEGNFIYLSKILDFSQQIKDFFIPLTQTEYHYFSISLSLLAVKREFLRLENWMEGRLKNGTLAWIEEFMVYITNHIINPFENYQNPSKEFIEDVLERAQLSMNTIAVIFENFFLNERFMSHIDNSIKEKIKLIYQSVQYFIPELSQICTNDTEKKANRILEDLYFQATTIEEFIKNVIQLKNSSSNSDQEILSCIIINIIDEFRFYHQFPEKELYITSDIFGQFIEKKIIDGKVQIVFLKALSDSLDKDEKMFNFALRAIQNFIENVNLDINEEFYNILFSNEKFRQEQYLMLYQLSQNLAKTKRYASVIPQNFIDEIQQRKKQADKIRENSQKNDINIQSGFEKLSLKKKLIMKGNKFLEKNLIEFLKNKFKNFDKSIALDKQSQEKITYYLNRIEEKRLDLTDFHSLLDSIKKINWFAVYLVYDRIPHEYSNQSIYQKLIMKSDFKDLYYEVYSKSMLMINQLIDYLIAKDQLTTLEYTISRNCGKWVSLITLYSNRPILLKDFDIKGKIYKAIEEQRLGNIIPCICTILLLVEKSSFFKINVPYINSLIDVLREILHIPCVPQQTRAYIDVLFNQLKIKQKNLYSFNYLQNRSKKINQVEKDKNMFNMKCLPDCVKIDIPNTPAIENQQEFRQLVAMAIDQSIKDIIQPVLERSVTNTLETTRELVIKDYMGEPDENKLIQGSEAMITYLTQNLALVTCKEPLKNQIQQNLMYQFKIQTNMTEQNQRYWSEQLSQINLKIACDYVKKIVIDSALKEIKKDQILQNEIQNRRDSNNNDEYTNQDFEWLKKELPQQLDPQNSYKKLQGIEIYSKSSEQKYDDDKCYYEMWQVQRNEINLKTFEKKKITDLIQKLDAEIQNKNENEKIQRINEIYHQLSKILSQSKIEGDEIKDLAINFLEQLFLQPIHNISIEKLKCYSDVLIICNNTNSQLASIITAWLFRIKNELYKHQLISVFLRRNLLHLKDFDKFYSQILTEQNQQGLICIVQVMKNLVIEDKIFSIHSFPLILEKMIQLGKLQSVTKLDSEIQIFLKNLIEYIENKNKMNSLMFQLTNLEPEYKKLFQDVNEYFKEINKEIYQQACDFIKIWKTCKNEEDFEKTLIVFQEKMANKGAKNQLIFFCYLVELAVNQSIHKAQNLKIQKIRILEYEFVDLISQFIVVLLKNSNEATQYFEKILTSIIIVLTKKHFFDEGQQFNQKPFFKILYNIVNNLNRTEKIFVQHRVKFSQVLAQTLHILQPIKYPEFSFAWVQLIGNPFLIKTLLNENNIENQNNFSILIIDLMNFYRDVFTVNLLQKNEVKIFYQGTLRILLVLIHDYPEFLSDQSFLILEEIPSNFKQFRNIILSAYPKNLKVQNPFMQQEKDYQEEFKQLPFLCQKIEARINSHNLHSVLINYIKKADPQQQNNENIQTILSSFYINGYQNQIFINKPLLESFVVYVPFFMYSNIQPNSVNNAFKSYLEQSYYLFINLLLTKDYKLRDRIIKSIMNNLRYPNYITFYFIDLILIIFKTQNKNNLFEQILQNLFSRLIIEKPHPWGILSLLYKILSQEGIDNKKFFINNKNLIEKLVQIAFKYAKINNQVNI